MWKRVGGWVDIGGTHGHITAVHGDRAGVAADRDESDDAARYDIKYDNDEEVTGVRADKMVPILLVRYDEDGYGQEGISARDLHGVLRSASGTARCTIYRPGCKLHVAQRTVAPPKAAGGGKQPAAAAAASRSTAGSVEEPSDAPTGRRAPVDRTANASNASTKRRKV